MLSFNLTRQVSPSHEKQRLSLAPRFRFSLENPRFFSRIMFQDDDDVLLLMDVVDPYDLSTVWLSQPKSLEDIQRWENLEISLLWDALD